LLYSLNTLSGVTSERLNGAYFRGLRQGPHFKVAAVASRWQRAADLIGSGYEPHTSRTRRERLITCAIWPVQKESNSKIQILLSTQQIV